MTDDQLRIAFAELNGQRDVELHFDAGPACTVQNAMLVPAEEDNLVKLTDGKHVYVLDAQAVSWVRIG